MAKTVTKDNGNNEKDTDAIVSLDITDETIKSIKLGDPLADNPMARLSYTGGDPRWSYAWRRPDEVYSCLESGQVMVGGNEGVRVPHGRIETVRGKRAWTIPHRKTGEIELVLFRVPKVLHDQMKEGWAKASRNQIDMNGVALREKLSKVFPSDSIDIMNGEDR